VEVIQVVTRQEVGPEIIEYCSLLIAGFGLRCQGLIGESAGLRISSCFKQGTTMQNVMFNQKINN